MNNLGLLLPIEIINHILEYNPEHYEKYRYVMDELVDYFDWTLCGNDMCESEIRISESIESKISNMTFHFCNNEHCVSYGQWSIRYDLRKHHR